MEVSAGTVVGGDYRIEKPIAAGGMGAVYVAEQLSTGKRRALKLMKPELMLDQGLVARFEQEARIGARIESEHIVEVVGAGIDAATAMPWLAMELLEGESLSALMRRRGAIDAVTARDLFSQIGHGLAAAHRAGVVHRDLKPENIFVARVQQIGVAFKVKILDFGIAKLFDSGRTGATGAMSLGTPRYMAPEQSGGQPITVRADVWSLGLIAFQVLVGRYYWKHAEGGPNDSVMTLMREVLFEPLVAASARAAEFGLGHLVPAGFDAWFGRTVAREPAARFAHAQEAIGALDQVLAQAAAAASTHAGPQGGSYAAAVSQAAPSHSAPWPASADPSMSAGGYGPTGPQVPQVHSGQGPQGAGAFTPQAAPVANTGAAQTASRRGVLLAALVGGGLLVAGGGAGLWLWSRDAKSAKKSDKERPRKSRKDEDEDDDEDRVPVVGPPAENIAGSYSIAAAQNPTGGTSYSGKVMITRQAGIHQVSWSTGQQGSGLYLHGHFAAAWGLPVHVVGLYRVSGGTLTGTFATNLENGVTHTHTLSGAIGLSGVYKVTQSSDNDTGQVLIEKTGATYKLLSKDRGSDIVGVGILHGDIFGVCYVPKTATLGGIALYKSSGKALHGRWTVVGGNQLGNERLER